MSKKILTAALPAAMLFSACSHAASGSTANTANPRPKAVIPETDIFKGEINMQTYPLSGEKITLEYWYPMSDAMGTIRDFNESEFFRWMEEKTNIHIEFIVPAKGEEASSLRNLFTTDQLPDIMYTYPATHSYRGGMDAAIDDGYILDLSDYIGLMPNYVSWLNSVPAAKKSVFTDAGRMYGFWGFWDNIESGYADLGISIRKDFLDQVGEDIPETYDDWERVLTKFRDELKIEAPLYTSKYGIDTGEFMAGYGIAPYFYQKDGTVMYGPMQDAYKDYLGMLHDWYEKGLLDPDFTSRKSTGIGADDNMILNDRIGALIDWGTHMTDAYVSRGASNREFMAVACPQPKKDADAEDPAWRAVGNNYNDMQSICLMISAKSRHIEEAIRWVDSFYAEDVYLNANYGIDSEEGTVWYRAEDGHRIGNFDFRYANPDGLDSLTVAAKYWAKNPPVRVEAAQIEQMPADRAASYKVWSQYPADNYIPVSVTMTSEETAEYAPLYTDIETFVQENNVKFIKGEKSLDEYDAYREQLKGMGIEKCISLRQAALDRYNGR
ncbi:MAG: hypothetical protein K6G61_02140 [Solobacterium sp.]|nr:hypothetical protein [Solobacterium sp.]